MNEERVGRRRYTHKHCGFLHGSFDGPGSLGPAAKKHSHGQKEDQESRHRRWGHQNETAIGGLVPGGVLCGTDELDMKEHMHHMECKIGWTNSLLLPASGRFIRAFCLLEDEEGRCLEFRHLQFLTIFPIFNLSVFDHVIILTRNSSKGHLVNMDKATFGLCPLVLIFFHWNDVVLHLCLNINNVWGFFWGFPPIRSDFNINDV